MGTFSFFWEWYNDGHKPEPEAEDEAVADTGSTSSPHHDMFKETSAGAEGLCEDKDKFTPEQTESTARDFKRDRARSISKLLLFSFATNLDNIGIYVMLMVKNVFRPLELL